jgi:hypothetical protein
MIVGYRGIDKSYKDRIFGEINLLSGCFRSMKQILYALEKYCAG